MKLNKRLIASVALSVSLVATAVIPAAWAADEHVTCTQNFRAGVDIDAAINLNVAKHLQRNRDWDWRQIAGLNVEQMGQLAKKLLKEDGTPLHSEEALKLLEPNWVGESAKYNSTFVSNDRMGSAGEEQQSGHPLSVNKAKAGDRKITGSVFVLPGQRKQLQISFPKPKKCCKKRTTRE
ncbi:intracellular motility protein A [Corynebacterium diphtheriae]|nr:intracellular motility protein A [Corynebacterium diphtheriae]